MRGSQHVERNEWRRDDYLRWVCGFANIESGGLVTDRNDKPSELLKGRNYR